jgi:hypothetical protein
MTAIQLKGRIRADGTLDVHVNTGLPESDAEVLVVVQPASTEKDERRLSWPDFVEKFAGIFADDPIVRGDQGSYEQREPLE